MADGAIDGRRGKAAATRGKAKAAAPSGGELPDTPDAVDIAMKALASGADRDGTARALLEKHSCLIDIQCRREHEELANVRVQRITRWLIVSAVAALLIGAAWAMVSASRSNSLVLEPLSVPPSLEARGLTGKVLSARLLDKLTEFQRLSVTTRANKSYNDNWQDDIKLDLGGSGFSIGETWLTMKRLLGRETRIAGEVTQAADGSLTVTTRAGAKSGGQHAGSEAELDQLITRAAEGIYGATQPYRYIDYLNTRNRPAERDRVLQELARDPEPVERKWAFNGLSVDARRRGDSTTGIAFANAALDIDPNFVNPLGNLSAIQSDLGHDEAALAYVRRAIRAAARSSAADYDLARLNRNTLGHKRNLARRLDDYLEAIETVKQSREAEPAEFDQKGTAAVMVGLHSGMHEHSRGAAAQRASAGRQSPRPVGSSRPAWIIMPAASRPFGAQSTSTNALAPLSPHTAWSTPPMAWRPTAMPSPVDSR